MCKTASSIAVFMLVGASFSVGAVDITYGNPGDPVPPGIRDKLQALLDGAGFAHTQSVKVSRTYLKIVKLYDTPVK